jgi:hypothetical protein
MPGSLNSLRTAWPDIWKPDDLYRKATAKANSASGFYNYNIKLTAQAGPVIGRMPIPETDVMDLVIWPESGVLRTIRDPVTHASACCAQRNIPSSRFSSSSRVSYSTPPHRGACPCQGHVIGDVAEALSQLCAIPREKIPPLPEDWPSDGKTADFARRLSAVTQGVYAHFQPDFHELFTSRDPARPHRHPPQEHDPRWRPDVLPGPILRWPRRRGADAAGRCMTGQRRAGPGSHRKRSAGAVSGPPGSGEPGPARSARSGAL